MKRLEFIVVLLSLLGCCPACHADKSCPVNSTPASEADQALYKNKPVEAEKLYREQLQREPNNDRVRGQLVRAVVDQDRIADADRLAQEFPKSELAPEAQYRAGRLLQAICARHGIDHGRIRVATGALTSHTLSTGSSDSSGRE